MATKTYKLKRKISATESEEVKFPASSVDGLSTVATSGSYNDLSNKPTIPSVPTNYVTTDTGQEITGNKTFSGSTTFRDIVEFDNTGDTNKNPAIRFGTSLQIDERGIFFDTESMDTVGIGIGMDADYGTDGQVLTSGGADGTIRWANVTKHGYTELTNEDLNTITEVGWYRAYTGHTCKNSPTTMGFVLSVERIGGTASPNYYIQQTITTTSITQGMIYRRRSNTGSGTPTTITMGWSTYKLVDQNTDEAFSGRKTFSNGINLNSSLQVNGSSGTAGQVLTSTGSGTPQWKTPSGGGSGDSVASVVSLSGTLVGGNSYTVFGNSEKGSFIGIINCEYSTSAGDFEFEINEEILTFTPTSQDVTLRVTIDRMYSNSVYKYYYTIVASDKSIDTSGFFTDTYTTMSISTSLGSSYYQGGVGVIIKKAV